jgi:hypothetical protein
MSGISQHERRHYENKHIGATESARILAEVMREVMRRAAAEGKPIDFSPPQRKRRQLTLDLQEVFAARS